MIGEAGRARVLREQVVDPGGGLAGVGGREDLAQLAGDERHGVHVRARQMEGIGLPVGAQDICDSVRIGR
ncbi:hypothetical protein GCM10009799_29220 [Nocardiopsis rhodophaea]|uniref:Uncharacterized protein n=1 Tax=Nocardiopsis rhodophaea TaxID=280238 RepID=A0ABN2T6J2_9ACTN